MSQIKHLQLFFKKDRLICVQGHAHSKDKNYAIQSPILLQKETHFSTQAIQQAYI